MAWEFLTNVPKLPINDLYVTYFGGDKEFGLPADLQTRDIWLRIGSVLTCWSLLFSLFFKRGLL